MTDHKTKAIDTLALIRVDRSTPADVVAAVAQTHSILALVEALAPREKESQWLYGSTSSLPEELGSVISDSSGRVWVLGHELGGPMWNSEEEGIRTPDSLLKVITRWKIVDTSIS